MTADPAVPAVVEARDVSRVFPMPAGPVVAVSHVALQIGAGDHVAICGPSGCGKSTLLHLLGCVDAPSGGTLLFDGHDVAALADRQRSQIRLTRIGFIFQRFFLLPMLTAAENVELPQAEAGAARAPRQQRTKELLDYVGLSARADHRPSQLSGASRGRGRPLCVGRLPSIGRVAAESATDRTPVDEISQAVTARVPVAGA